MARYVLAIDEGTTSTRAMLIDQRLSVKGNASVEFKQIFPQPGWVEHKFDEIWTATLKAIGSMLIPKTTFPFSSS